MIKTTALKVLAVALLGAALTGCTDREPTPAPLTPVAVEVTPAPEVTVPADLVDELAGAIGEPIDAEFAEWLAQEPGQADRDWSVCRWFEGDTSYVICPDGYRVSS